MKLDVKRMYAPDSYIDVDCDDCGRDIGFDGNCDYLEYPIINEPFEYHAYCNNCDTTTSKKIELIVRIIER